MIRFSHDMASPNARVARCGAPVSEDMDGGTVTCPDCLAIREQLRGHPDPRSDDRLRGDPRLGGSR